MDKLEEVTRGLKEIGFSNHKVRQIIEDENSKEYLTPKELATKLNVSLRIIREKTYANKIPGQIKIFGRWRYNLVEIEKALKGGFLE